MKDNQQDLSSRLITLTSELEAMEAELRATGDANPGLLQDFRRSVDEVRNTAWTIGELINARESRKNPQVVLSFIAAERMRRFSQMVRSLTADIDEQGPTWETGGIQDLFDTLSQLQVRLSRLISQHRARVQRSGDSER